MLDAEQTNMKSTVMFTMLISTLLFTQSSATFDHTCETRDYDSSHLWHWRRSLVTHVRLVITARHTCDIGDDRSSHVWDSWLRLITPVTLVTIARHTCETRELMPGGPRRGRMCSRFVLERTIESVCRHFGKRSMTSSSATSGKSTASSVRFSVCGSRDDKVL